MPEVDLASPACWLSSSSVVSQFSSHIEPGQRVRHPNCPEWGIGQVQSAIADRVTVNFPNAGKVVINAQIVSLEIVEAASRDQSD